MAKAIFSGSNFFFIETLHFVYSALAEACTQSIPQKSVGKQIIYRKEGKYRGRFNYCLICFNHMYSCCVYMLFGIFLRQQNRYISDLEHEKRIRRLENLIDELQGEK